MWSFQQLVLANNPTQKFNWILISNFFKNPFKMDQNSFFLKKTKTTQKSREYGKYPSGYWDGQGLIDQKECQQHRNRTDSTT